MVIIVGHAVTSISVSWCECLIVVCFLRYFINNLDSISYYSAILHLVYCTILLGLTVFVVRSARYVSGIYRSCIDTYIQISVWPFVVL